MLFHLFIYDRHCAPVFTKKYFNGEYAVNESDLQKLIFGLVVSLKNTMKKLNSEYICHSTDTFKLHYFETPTGYKFVLTTSPSEFFTVSPSSSTTEPSLRASLQYIYTHYFMPFVILNPQQKLSTPTISMKERKALYKAGKNLLEMSPKVNSPLFEERVDLYLRSLRL
eukprot:NODE_347_length_10448_cov_0.163687.p8 type:complete len:168 gc:universal NODE_347_length_10448_cov_0.163687:6517-6014(-)